MLLSATGKSPFYGGATLLCLISLFLILSTSLVDAQYGGNPCNNLLFYFHKIAFSNYRFTVNSPAVLESHQSTAEWSTRAARWQWKRRKRRRRWRMPDPRRTAWPVSAVGTLLLPVRRPGADCRQPVSAGRRTRPGPSGRLLPDSRPPTNCSR